MPADLSSLVIDQLLQFGETRRGWLGVNIDEVTPRLASELGFDRPRGAIVSQVRPNRPALLAGMQPRDVILDFNKPTGNSVRDLTRAVAETPVGETVPVTILRDKKRMTLNVKVDRRETRILAALPGAPLPQGAAQSAGLTLQKATREVAEAFGVIQGAEGVVVTAIDPESAAATVLQPGDIIIEIGWERMTRPEAAALKLDKLRNLNSGPVQIYVQRGDTLFYESLRP